MKPESLVLILIIIYLLIVTICFISMFDKKNVALATIFYVMNGVYIVIYGILEVFMHKRTASTWDEPSPFVSWHARVLTGTVIAALIFSTMSGYEGFFHAFEYNFRSHMFMVFPNCMVFIVKYKTLTKHEHLFIRPLMLMFLAGYIVVVAIYFDNNKD